MLVIVRGWLPVIFEEVVEAFDEVAATWLGPSSASRVWRGWGFWHHREEGQH